MKLLVFSVFVAFVQMCISVPLVKREVVASALTDSDIDQLRKDLRMIPGVDPKVIDSFADIFYNFRENSTDNEVLEGTIKLISLATNVDVSKINRTLLAEYPNSSSSSSEENVENRLHSDGFKKLPDEGITENELKNLEEALLKELTPSQTKQVMNTFRGLREGATSKETENALFELFVSAIYGALNMPTKGQGAQSNADENVIIIQLNDNEINQI